MGRLLPHSVSEVPQAAPHARRVGDTVPRALGVRINGSFMGRRLCPLWFGSRVLCGPIFLDRVKCFTVHSELLFQIRRPLKSAGGRTRQSRIS